MEKGKFGITMKTYVVLALAFAILGWTVPLVLVAAVAIFIEKDEWAGEQTLAVTFLALLESGVAYAIRLSLGFLRDILHIFSYDTAAYSIGTVIGHAVTVLITLVNIAIVLVLLIAIFSVSKGQAANLPIVSGWAKKAYGKIVAVAPPAPVYQQHPQQPAYPQQPQQYGYQQAPQPMAQQQPVAPPAPAYPQQPPVPPTPPVPPVPPTPPVGQ